MPLLQLTNVCVAVFLPNTTYLSITNTTKHQTTNSDSKLPDGDDAVPSRAVRTEDLSSAIEILHLAGPLSFHLASAVLGEGVLDDLKFMKVKPFELTIPNGKSRSS
jgi:hypothetical protein